MMADRSPSTHLRRAYASKLAPLGHVKGLRDLSRQNLRKLNDATQLSHINHTTPFNYVLIKVGAGMMADRSPSTHLRRACALKLAPLGL